MDARVRLVFAMVEDSGRLPPGLTGATATLVALALDEVRRTLAGAPPQGSAN